MPALTSRLSGAAKSALDLCTRFANVGGSLIIAMLVLLIGSDVLLRNLFSHPLTGVPELVSMSIVAIVFLQAPEALRAGRMTRSDALITRFAARRPKAGRVVETVHDLAGLTVIVMILLATYPRFVQAWRSDEFVGAVGQFTAPVWPVRLLLLVGGALLALQFVARIISRHAGHAR